MVRDATLLSLSLLHEQVYARLFAYFSARHDLNYWRRTQQPLFNINTTTATLVYTGHSNHQMFISDESRVSTLKLKSRGMVRMMMMLGLDSYRALASTGRALARSTAAASVVGA